jgi:hypothetical protein
LDQNRPEPEIERAAPLPVAEGVPWPWTTLLQASVIRAVSFICRWKLCSR